MASPSFAIMSEVTKSEFSSASSAASSQTDDMDDDDDEDLAPPPLSRSCGSMGSMDLQTPARETGHNHNSSSSSSTGVSSNGWDDSAPVPVYSLDATIRSPKLMYRSSSYGKDASTDGSHHQLATSPLGRNGLSQSLGLFLGDSPNQLPSSNSEQFKPSNGSPQLFRMQRPPSSSSSLLSKRHTLALSPLKIAPGSSSMARPNQPQTPGGSIFPYARDGAATGEMRSPFEPPTPLRALPSTVDGFPFGPVGRNDRVASPMMGNAALRNSSVNGSLSPISADFAAALTISHPKLRDDSQSRSPSPAGSRRTSMMEPSTPSSNKRIKESGSSMDGLRGATTGPTRPKMVKSKSAVGKPYGSPITYRTQPRETSPTLSSPLSKEPTNANGPPPTPSGFVKPLIIATPPQGTEELPMDELPGLPAPILQFPSGSSSSKSTAKAPSSSSTDARVGKPVQMQAPPMDRSMSEPVFPTVSARHLAHRRLHPVFEAKYTLGHELGSGGFGFVVNATSSVDGRPVAVKFIWKDKVPSHGWVRDPHLGVIPMEAFALKVIDHPNVVKFIELFDDEEFFYLVMEMHGSPWKAPEAEDKLSAKKAAPSASSASSIPGSPNTLAPPARPVPMERRSSYDLFECIEQHSRLSEEQARWVFAQVVEAVWYLDTLGICHRDIKDENCVVDSDFNVKLIDFGSAVLSDPRKPPPYFNRFFGMMTFASSEILQGKQYRAPHAEVWSLGVLLSILLSGQCPFADPSAAIKGQISKPKGMWTRDSLGLMLRCLEVTPDTRATISEIRNHPWVAKAWEMNGRKRAQPL